MLMMRNVVIFLVVLISGFSARAQQDAMFSHYMFNTQSINPGSMENCPKIVKITILMDSGGSPENGLSEDTRKIIKKMSSGASELFEKRLIYCLRTIIYIFTCV